MSESKSRGGEGDGDRPLAVVASWVLESGEKFECILRDQAEWNCTHCHYLGGETQGRW